MKTPSGTRDHCPGEGGGEEITAKGMRGKRGGQEDPQEKEKHERDLGREKGKCMRREEKRSEQT